MASVLVYIQTEGAEAQPASLGALGEARRIATTLGGTLYAAVTVSGSAAECGPLIEQLGERGADRVAMAQSPSHDSPCMWANRGPALLAAIKRIKPNLVVVAANEAGRDIAPRLAAHLQAAYCAEPSVQYGSHGEVVLSRTLYGATYRQRISAEEIDVPVVVALTPGSYKPADGGDEAEVLFIDCEDRKPALELVETTSDPGAELDRARIIVTAGAGCDQRARQLVDELAAALGGESAWTRKTASNLGRDGARTIDVRGRSVAPQLYIACGASGSMAHLGAVSSDSEIVAINSDPKAPIFRVASYGIVGDATDVLTGLLDEVKKRETSAG
ncbi:MAG: electron transfer flavoprotein subunit alpha/FixB family protein [Deltaproteobacteria bacterium]|nr:electron transfer flavoprotein subunit alpha/FixB family protein [Deltaproteobacteria bacterium]